MHSFWQRLNAIFFYTLYVLGFLAFAAAGTTYWHSAEPHVSVSLKKIMLRKIMGAGHDQAILSLQIDADLRSVFNWNVKQLFVYITAEYETEANVRARTYAASYAARLRHAARHRRTGARSLLPQRPFFAHFRRPSAA